MATSTTVPTAPTARKNVGARMSFATTKSRMACTLIHTPPTTNSFHSVKTAVMSIFMPIVATRM